MSDQATDQTAKDNMDTTDGNNSGGEGQLGGLPVWNLDDLYPGVASPQLQQDMDDCGARAKNLRARFEGKLAGLEGVDLASAIADYEALDEVLSKIMSYAQLVYSGNMADPEIGKFYQSCQERVTGISTALVFFVLELNQIDDAALAEKLKDPALARYAPWIADQRAFRPHQLSEELERALHEKNVTGRAAWTRLFDETMAGLRFPFRGRDLTSAEILNLMSDREADKRRGRPRPSAMYCRSTKEPLPSSPTPWPRTRRSKTPGAASGSRSPRVIWPTSSRTR